MTMIPVPELTLEEQIERARAQSVQRTPEVSKQGTPNYWSIAGWRGTFLSARGTLQRERELRDWYFADEQVLVRGAFTGIAKHIGNLPWEITGDDTPNAVFAGMGRELGRDTESGVEYFQEILRQANFGAGWGQLITQVVLDYFRYDTGAFIEVIGAGDSYSPLNGPVTALAHLDPLACIPTGDPLYPVVYYDLYGGIHPMHFTRLICLQDMNDGDQRRPGWGDSALARAISIAAREMWITRYINAYLDDEPPPGLDLIGGITKGMFESAEQAFKNQQQQDVKPIWGKRMRYYTADPAIMPKIESKTFQAAPEKFDFRVYTDIDVDVLALAMGIDRLDLMQLSGGGAIGSEAQSIIMHQKSKGKTIGYLITELERRFNDLLPTGYTFAFKYRDEQEAKQEAEKANLWADVVGKLKGLLTPEQCITLLASNVEPIHEAISNAPRVNDVDIQPESTPVVAPDDSAGAEEVGAETPEETPPPESKAYKGSWNESDHPRADDGKFGSGGGGIGAAAGIARDSNGQPEFIPAGHNKPLVKNPYYSGKPSGSPPPGGAKPAPKPDKPAGNKPDSKPDKKPANDKPDVKPKPDTGAVKPGKKPEWSDYNKRKPSVDAEGYQDYSGMDNDTRATNRAYELSEGHTSKLSRQQKSAAETYTGGDYQDINGGLRSGKVPAKYKKTVEHLDSAIDQSRLPENTTLYRGMNMTPAMRERMRPGATFSDAAYTSTSINPRVPDSFARGDGKTMMRIKAPKGTKGMAVNNVSNFDGEHEVLLPRNTGYRITNVYHDKRTGMTYVDAEILGGDS